jgi:transcriptional regulator NrdR family protein
MKQIVKRRGHSEAFDERKLYASVYHACLSVRVPVAEAELVARQVSEDTAGWLDDKRAVTSSDIFRQAAQHFSVYNAEAAYMYKHFRSVS